MHTHISKTYYDNSERTQFNFRSIFRGNLTVMGASNVVRGFGSGLISTFTSLYFVGLGGTPLMLGVMTATISIINAFVSLVGGYIADYYGRKTIVITAAFYVGFFPLLYTLTSDWRLFMVLSSSAAIGLISTPSSKALIVESIPHKRRTTGIAVLQVISSLPAMFSPMVGGWLIQNYGLGVGFRLACVYTGVSFFISASILLLFLKETLFHKREQTTEASCFEKLKNLLKLPRHFQSSLKGLLLSHALITFANAAVGPYYILYAVGIIGLTPLQWAPIASIQSLSVLLKIPGGWLSDKFGKRNIMVLSILACAPCAMLFSLAQSFLQTLIVALLLITTGIYYAPAYEALQADLTPRRTRGRVIAFWQFSSALSLAIGTLTGGFLFQAYPAIPFYLFTVTELAAATILASFVKEPKTKES